jgi:hypothetical protein
MFVYRRCRRRAHPTAPFIVGIILERLSARKQAVNLAF